MLVVVFASISPQIITSILWLFIEMLITVSLLVVKIWLHLFVCSVAVCLWCLFQSDIILSLVLFCMLWYSVKPRYLVSETYRHKHLETFCQWCWELCVSVHGVFQKVIDRFEEHYMEGKPWTNEEWLNFGTDMDPWSIFHFFSSARWGIFWHCSVCH